MEATVEQLEKILKDMSDDYIDELKEHQQAMKLADEKIKSLERREELYKELIIKLIGERGHQRKLLIQALSDISNLFEHYLIWEGVVEIDTMNKILDTISKKYGLEE